MAINKNHEFEELNGIKCAIVEKNASVGRVNFLKDLLEFNKYDVVIVASAPPKVVPPAAPPVSTTTSEIITENIPLPPPSPPPPETYTVGVTDVSFNPINAIFGRLLKSRDGHIVTLAYWQQKENVSQDEIPYYEKRI